MSKGAALQAFFERFLTAYAASSVPIDAVFPYLTYEMATSAWQEGEVGLTVNLWYYTDNEALPNAKAQEIANAVGNGGVLVPCGGGAVWLKRGAPWCQNLRDEADPQIKRRYINLTAEYLTLD